MKKKIIVLLLVVIFIISFGANSTIAHEMYEYNNAPVELFYAHFDQNYMPYIRINGDALSSTMSPYFFDEYEKWDDFNSELTFTHVSSSPDVICETPSFAWWDNAYSVPWNSLIKGITYIYDSDGFSLNAGYLAYYSDRYIDYAVCKFNPYDGHDTSETNHLSSFGPTSKSHLINHEIGHALGLGHSDNYSPTTTASLMYSVCDGSATFYAPRSHDMVDIENKYD